MDFKGKDRVRQRVSQNSQLLQALTALTAQVQALQAAVAAPDAEPAANAADAADAADAAEGASDAAPARRPVKGGRGRISKSSVLQGEAKPEHPFVRAARQTAANATRPR